METGRVIKGDTVFIPILAINRSKELWGEDAFEFKCVLPLIPLRGMVADLSLKARTVG